MLVEILCGFQIFLSVLIIIAIYFARPDTSGLSSLAQNFNQTNRRLIRLKPSTKLILCMVFLFFINSIVINKILDNKSKERHSIFDRSLDIGQESQTNKTEEATRNKTEEEG
jgi:preprotein translocase subunit SecG